MAWILLVTAGVLECAWAIALKSSEGFSKPLPSVIFLVTATVSFVLLALALRDLPAGTGYAVWTGIGAVGTAILGIVLLDESAALGRLAAIALIATGIIWLAASPSS